MKQTARIISTYTGDTSGVCSALYELGGMTVMHDASGCNSTYNTHDEPRWYDTDSLVFISALTETQAIMGDDEKLISDMTEAANELSPKFIALAGTPIPMMTGTDYAAIARETQRRTGIPCFGFATDGMHSYVHGASMAFEAVAKHFCKTREEIAADDVKRKENINIKNCDCKIISEDESFSASSDMRDICIKNSGINDVCSASDGGNNGSENASCKGTVDITNGVKDCTYTYERNDTSTSVNMNICGKNSLSDAENTTCNGDARKNNGKNALKNECERIKVNILGVTPLDFSLTGSHLEMKKLLENEGFEVVSVWAMDDTLENIERSVLADVNLVVASCGIKAARVLEKRFAIPFVIGTPFGSFKENVISAIRMVAAEKKNRIPCIEELKKCNADCEKNDAIPRETACETICETHCETEKISQNCGNNYVENDCSDDCNKELRVKLNLKTVIIGESVTALSLARAIEKKYGCDCLAVSAVETEGILLGKKCVFARDEDEIIPYLKNADVIIADPMYKPICPVESKFVALPHEAFSGRIYRKDIPELVSGCDAFLEKNF